MKAIIFTKYDLNQSQLNELKNIYHYKDDEIIYLKELASKNINNENELFQVYDELINEIKFHLDNDESVMIFGVETIPVPLRGLFANDELDLTIERNNAGILIPVYEAWNINKSKESEKPIFEHYRFILTGYFSIVTL